MGAESCSPNTTKEFVLNYIGNKSDFKNEAIFKLFDIDYINLNILPYIYYPINNDDSYYNFINNKFSMKPTAGTNTPSKNELIKKIEEEFKTTLKKMDNSNVIYNKYLITPITITIIIIWIFLILFILKYIHYNYNILYLYLISTIIVILLIFGSIWFLYVNSQLL